jgi:hypothetical protein
MGKDPHTAPVLIVEQRNRCRAPRNDIAGWTVLLVREINVRAGRRAAPVLLRAQARRSSPRIG